MYVFSAGFEAKIVAHVGALFAGVILRETS